MGNNEYVTQDYSPLKIVKCAAATCNGFTATLSATVAEYWQVQTGDGTRYIFGNDANSQNLVNTSTDGSSGTNYPRAWFLRRVHVAGRDSETQATAEYTYETGNGSITSGCFTGPPEDTDPCHTVSATDHWHRIVSIRYGYSTDPAQQYKVAFMYPDASSPRILAVKVTRGTDSTPTNLRQYCFGQTGQSTCTRTKNEIDFIEEQSWNTTTSAWQALPRTTFTYWDSGGRFGGQDKILINRIWTRLMGWSFSLQWMIGMQKRWTSLP